MKIHEYNQMMAYLTRPATPTETPDTRQQAASGGRIELATGSEFGQNQFTKLLDKSLKDPEYIKKLVTKINLPEYADMSFKDLFKEKVITDREMRELQKLGYKAQRQGKKVNDALVKARAETRLELDPNRLKDKAKELAGRNKKTVIHHGLQKRIPENLTNLIVDKTSATLFSKAEGVLQNLDAEKQKLLNDPTKNKKRINEIQAIEDRLKKGKTIPEVTSISTRTNKPVTKTDISLKTEQKGLYGYENVDIDAEGNVTKKLKGVDKSKTIAGLSNDPITKIDFRNASKNDQLKIIEKIQIKLQPEVKKIAKIIGASEKEISNFSKAVLQIQNKVGSTPVNDFIKLGVAQSKDIGNFVTKYGLGAGKLALKGLIVATPVFAGMEVMEASEKFKQGESAGQIIADIAGNWIVPGIGEAYDAEEKNRLMKDIARPEELEALDKYNRYRSGQKMAEGAIEFGEEETAAQQMSENVNTPEEQLNLFKLLEKGETADFYNKQRLAAKRAAEPLPEIEDYGIDIGDVIEEYNNGGRVGYADGPKDPKRRTVIKGLTALATLPFIGKYFKLAKVAPKVSGAVKVAIEKVSGMPNWFQPFVNKVLKMGDDVTDSAATAEREIVKRIDIEDATVDVHYNTATNDVKVEVFGGNKTALDQPLELNYKAPEVIEETGKKTKGEFKAVESRPEAVQTGPDDYDFEAGENVTDVLDDLLSETDYLEGFATGKIRTPAEIKRAKNKAFHRRNMKEDPAQYILEEDMANFSNPDAKAYETITNLDEIENLLTITKTKK